jgi:hypothetical protein
MTARGDAADRFDLSLFGTGATGPVMGRWEVLGARLGFRVLAHGRQVHGSTVRLHEVRSPGLHVAPATDGHVTARAGVLLTVSAADCVPIFLVDPERRAVAALHGGWRGIAAGILEAGLAVLGERLASSPADLHMHLGPAICGGCYEVGPEVHQALGLGTGLAAVSRPTPVDLRTVLVGRAVAAGVSPDRITRSELCTLCGDSPFFSHRGGDAERQVGFIGVRDP